ncbi:hypothetical protein Trydic_g8550 [Trypoxylus dichotomus]
MFQKATRIRISPIYIQRTSRTEKNPNQSTKQKHLTRTELQVLADATPSRGFRIQSVRVHVYLSRSRKRFDWIFRCLLNLIVW